MPVLAAVAIVVAWRMGYMDLDRRDNVIALLRRAHGQPLAVPLFVLAYAAAIAVALPTTVLTILGGALFGPLIGALGAWTGMLVGTVLTHTIAHSIGKGAVTRLFSKHALFKKLCERGDVWGIMRLRVVPIAPFGVLDYVAGLVGVPLRTILIATAMATIPHVTAYSYAGHQFRIALENPGTSGRQALLVAGGVTLALSAIAILPWLAGKLRRSA